MVEARFNPEVEREAFRQAASDKVRRLLDSGINTEKVAEILGAQKFLTKSSARGGEAVHFDVAGFITKQIEEQGEVRLPEQITELDQIILPPGEGKIEQGIGKGIEKKEQIPRTAYLLELLADESLQYEIFVGQVSPNMVRNLGYSAVYLPELGKTVFVNDEEGNATFIVDTPEKERLLKGIITQTKEELNQSHDVKKIVYPGDKDKWQTLIRDELLETGDKSKDAQKPPPRWMSQTQIVGLSSRSHKWVKSRLAQYEDQARTYSTAKGGQETEYYPPEVVAVLLEDSEKYKNPPDGWKTISSLAEVAGKTYKWVSSRLKNDLASSEFFLEPISHKVLRYYPPEVAVRIVGEAGKFQAPPEGWKTAHKISLELNISEYLVAKYSKDLKPKVFLNENGRKRNYFSPEDIELISEKALKYEKPPEGWMIRSEMVNLTGRTYRWINYRLKEFQEMAREHVDPMGRLAYFYPPEVVTEIERMSKESEKSVK